MATIKEIRRRIRSVQSTQQITKAMEMVAAAKLRRAQDRSVSARPYAAKMTEILKSLSMVPGERSHPLFEKREIKRRTIVVISSDKGLCGSFNANVIRQAELIVRGAEHEHIDLIPVGRRSVQYFTRRDRTGSFQIPELGDQVRLERALSLARAITDMYVKRETDQVDFVFTHFVSTATRRIVHEVFLPIAPEEDPGKARATKDYIFEPSADEIYAELLPRYVLTRVMSAMADSIASEHAARLLSMSAATKNARELIDSLTLIRNKLRQAAITKEISELIGGAEALK
jgi:F-type H+-transporting ATPase subunit gamma